MPPLLPRHARAQIAALIEAHVAAHLPVGCNASVTELGFRSHPYAAGKESLPNRAAAKVLTALMGNPPKWVRSGATIPGGWRRAHVAAGRAPAVAQGLPTPSRASPRLVAPCPCCLAALAAFQQHLGVDTTGEGQGCSCLLSLAGGVSPARRRRATAPAPMLPVATSPPSAAVFAFNLPDSRMHAPNENFRRACCGGRPWRRRFRAPAACLPAQPSHCRAAMLCRHPLALRCASLRRLAGSPCTAWHARPG